MRFAYYWGIGHDPRMPEDHFTRPILTVDCVPLTLHEGVLCVLRSVRKAEPYAGRPALLGGYVHVDEDADLDATARRVLADKVGLTEHYIEQLATFSGADRDPRGWSASVAYFSLSPYAALEPVLGRDGSELVPVGQAAGMPFDHDAILAAALARLRGKGAYSDLPARLLPDGFTLSELHRTYQIALDEQINIDAFRRKVLERGFLEDTGETRQDDGAKRPARIYRLTNAVSVFDRRV